MTRILNTITVEMSIKWGTIFCNFEQYVYKSVLTILPT